jgi:hypothetical protein
LSYPVWTPGSWIFDKNFPQAVNGVPVAQPNLTDSPTVTWTLDPLTMKVTANFNGVNPSNPTFIYVGTADPTVTAGLLTGSLYINTSTGSVFELQVVGSSNTWVSIGSIQQQVSSVFGRNGAVVAQFGDYSFSEIAGSATPGQIPTLDQITGTATASQLPNLSGINGSITSSQLPFPIVSGNINNVITVDGTTYTTIQQALAALPAVGGTIDMRGNNSSAALAIGTFDPGNKAVTLLLGPYTYTVNQITLRTNFRIFGSGVPTQNTAGTTLQATGGNATPPIVIFQTDAVQHVNLSDFLLQATVGNTSQTGINVIAGATFGLWYSSFNDIYINGFMGISFNLDGQASGSVNQFNTFRQVIAIRPLNSSYALQIIGFNNSLKFENCQFDGTFNTQDGQTNINISQGTGTAFVPYNIKFDLLTCQFAGRGLIISGADTVSIDQGHFEAVQGVLQVGVGSGFGSLGITMHDSGFFNNTGIGTASPGLGVGQGFIVNQTAATLSAGISILNCHAYSGPDSFFIGNIADIVQWGITQGTEGSYTLMAPVLGSPVGFGTGSSGTAVTTTTLGGGTGPAAPQTIVLYQRVTIGGVAYWIPLFA